MEKFVRLDPTTLLTELGGFASLYWNGGSSALETGDAVELDWERPGGVIKRRPGSTILGFIYGSAEPGFPCWVVTSGVCLAKLEKKSKVRVGQQIIPSKRIGVVTSGKAGIPSLGCCLAVRKRGTVQYAEMLLHFI